MARSRMSPAQLPCMRDMDLRGRGRDGQGWGGDGRGRMGTDGDGSGRAGTDRDGRGRGRDEVVNRDIT